MSLWKSSSKKQKQRTGLTHSTITLFVELAVNAFGKSNLRLTVISLLNSIPFFASRNKSSYIAKGQLIIRFNWFQFIKFKCWKCNLYLTRRPGSTFRREIINISLVKYKYIIMTNMIFLCSMFLLIIIIKVNYRCWRSLALGDDCSMEYGNVKKLHSILCLFCTFLVSLQFEVT